MAIVQQLKDINTDAGQFVAGLLSYDISREDQLTFALRLVRLAGQIKQRASSTAGMVIEGDVPHDGGSRRPALTAGAAEPAGHPGPAVDE
ncbi:hypothetical protein [Streptomyces sp. TS71-3]|uniref:hypothetical protein n=1 Tax=Streptomyces sp. TS71-3 TaxID=2733862 RepID=UPI001BB2EFDA|nr:hypothetical protein [Streptomyces sp. TS71-3]